MKFLQLKGDNPLNNNLSVNECIEKISKEYDVSKLSELGDVNNILFQAISSIVNIPVLKLMLEKNNIFLNSSEYEKFENAAKKMILFNVPIQYITGRVNIYNEEYIVTPDVLIPRSDTEILIDTAIRYINKNSLKNMIDICTGSGVVGISIAKNSSVEKVILSDISKEAIEVAKKNIILNKAENKCTTCISDIFLDIPYISSEKYDIIVGNPPYIETKVIDELSSYVKSEPMLALDGGISGLDIYERIFKEAGKYLKEGALVILEIGYDQREAIAKMLLNSEYELLEVIKDINLKDRVIVCRFHQR